MPLETGTTISDLDSLWPLSTDSVTRGDDHIRLLKAILKAQFPGELGDGFNVPITLTETFLNNLPTTIAAIQAAEDAKYPIGKVELFIDDTDPNDDFPGTWQLITGDASLSLGDGTAGAGSISGDNEVAVPLFEHSHSMNHTHTRGSMDITGYFTGDDRLAQNPKSGAFYNGTNQGGEGADGGGGTGTVYFQASRSWTGSTSQPSNSQTGTTGTASPTMNVRGAQLPVNVWKRVA